MRGSVAARRTAFALMLAGLAIALAACGESAEPPQVDVTPPASELIEVRLGDLVIQAEVAQTPQERTQGLSGRASLAEDGGMLFVHQEDRRMTLWMKDMRFALDFIWISADGRVVDLTQDVQPPEPGTPDEELARYQPIEPVRYVLEVNAGTVREAGIEEGDIVAFEPNIWRESPQ